MKENKCEHCGTVIIGNRRKQFCPDCLKYRQKQQKEACLARKKAKALEDKIGKSKLLNDVREAKKLGISYGRYKARQYSERQLTFWKPTRNFYRLKGLYRIYLSVKPLKWLYKHFMKKQKGQARNEQSHHKRSFNG